MVNVLILALCWIAIGAAPVIAVLDASYHDRQRYYDENYRTAYAHGFANDVELDAGIARERRSEDAAVPIATSTDRTDNNHTPWPTGTVYVTGRHHGSPAFLNTVLLIAIIVAVAICFVLGVIIAVLCYRSLKTTRKANSAVGYKSSPPKVEQGKSSEEYQSEEQAQLYNYEARVAQIRRNLNSHRGITPSASGAEDTQTDGDDEDTVDAPRTNTPELIIGTNGPAQVSSAKIRNPVFDSARHGQIGTHAPLAKSPSTPDSADKQKSGRKHWHQRGAAHPHGSPSRKSTNGSRTQSSPEPASSLSSSEKMSSSTAPSSGTQGSGQSMGSSAAAGTAVDSSKFRFSERSLAKASQGSGAT